MPRTPSGTPSGLLSRRVAWDKILSARLAMAMGHHSHDACDPRCDSLRNVRDPRIRPHLSPRPFRQPFPLHRRLSKAKRPCRLETCSSENCASGVPAGEDSSSKFSVPTIRRGSTMCLLPSPNLVWVKNECVIPVAIHTIDLICT